MTKEKHVHDFQPAKKIVPLHNYVIENGKIIKDRIQGRDILKQYVCACGETQTADLERKLA